MGVNCSMKLFYIIQMKIYGFHVTKKCYKKIRKTKTKSSFTKIFHLYQVVVVTALAELHKLELCVL